MGLVGQVLVRMILDLRVWFLLFVAYSYMSFFDKWNLFFMELL